MLPQTLSAPLLKLCEENLGDELGELVLDLGVESGDPAGLTL